MYESILVTNALNHIYLLALFNRISSILNIELNFDPLSKLGFWSTEVTTNQKTE